MPPLIFGLAGAILGYASGALGAALPLLAGIAFLAINAVVGRVVHVFSTCRSIWTG